MGRVTDVFTSPFGKVSGTPNAVLERPAGDALQLAVSKVRLYLKIHVRKSWSSTQEYSIQTQVVRASFDFIWFRRTCNRSNIKHIDPPILYPFSALRMYCRQ